MLDMFFLLAGFVPLLWGADLLVTGSSSLAKKFDIPDLVIGLTLVAFGTSSPELVVNLFASWKGTTDIALGNVVGSNIFNILGILGISALVFPLGVKKTTTWIEIPLCVLGAFLVILTAHDELVDKRVFSEISRIDGIIYLLFFVIFLVYNIQLSRAGRSSDDGHIADYPVVRSLLYAAGGLVMLILGGQLIVAKAVAFSRYAGIPERIIGITIVSIGTSLPELATSVMAARKHAVDIAVGNIVGSNIFNTFFILGLSSAICPVPLSSGASWDLNVNLVASLVLFMIMFTGKRARIDRWEGVLLLMLYTGYMLSLIFVK